jgi:hypothetical protein
MMVLVDQGQSEEKEADGPVYGLDGPLHGIPCHASSLFSFSFSF